jgi:hypothetical protein
MRFWALILLLLCGGCNMDVEVEVQKSAVIQPRVINQYYSIIVMEECEYFIGRRYWTLIHKANCTNQYHVR